MDIRYNFWLAVLAPEIVFFAGLCWGGDWIFLDAFFALCITIYFLSLYLWHKGFRQFDGIKKYAALVFPLSGLLFASFGCLVGNPLLMARLGFPWAQYRMAQVEELREMREGGSSQWQLRAQAAEQWYRMAAESGYAPAQFMMYEYTQDKRSQERWKWLRAAANQGYAIAEECLADAYERGEEKDGLPRDELQAAQWYHKAAEHGNEVALRKLAPRMEKIIDNQMEGTKATKR